MNSISTARFGRAPVSLRLLMSVLLLSLLAGCGGGNGNNNNGGTDPEVPPVVDPEFPITPWLNSPQGMTWKRGRWKR